MSNNKPNSLLFKDIKILFIKSNVMTLINNRLIKNNIKEYGLFL